MAIPVFNRGLRQEFVDRLNELYHADGWWRGLVDDKDLFIAIRDNCVNVYFQGCSVLKLSWSPSKRAITREIHYKYLLKPSVRGSPYIGFDEAGPILPSDPNCLFLDGLDNVDEMKRAVMPYAGIEKRGVHDVVVRGRNSNVVDLEVAISAGTSVPRIDLAAIHKDTDHPGSSKLVFYEAKHFQNKELRSGTDTIPVVDQIGRYSRLLNENHNALVDSYRQVCRNLSELEGVVQPGSVRHSLLRDIATGSVELLIDDQPRLIAFGFDMDQRDGKIWGRHAERLRDELTEERTLFVGKAMNVRLDGR